MSLKILCVFAVAGAGWFVPAQAFTLSGGGSFTGAEPTMTPRFNRDATPPGPSCSEFSSGNFQYQSVDFMSDASGALTASFDSGSCLNDVMVTFHSPSFNPANICSNHIYSRHLSGPFVGENIPVPPNSPIRMILSATNNITSPNLVCGPFSYTIQNTIQSSNTLQENIACASNAINALNPPDVVGPAQKNMMLGLLGLASNYAVGPYSSLSLLTLNSVLARFDGCALRTTPDTIAQGATGIDFLTTCAAQATAYSCAKAAQGQLMGPPPVR